MCVGGGGVGMGLGRLLCVWGGGGLFGLGFIGKMLCLGEERGVGIIRQGAVFGGGMLGLG